MMKKDKSTVNLRLTSMGHTWIIDLDGTIVKHNGYKIDGQDSFLPGAREFLEGIPEKDMILFLTSRTESEKKLTEDFLMKNSIRYDQIIYGAPYGERILLNDKKPSGLTTAFAVNTNRDLFCNLQIVEDDEL